MRDSSLLILDMFLPRDLLFRIDQYLVRRKDRKKEVSPSMQRELQKIQTIFLRGKSSMYMRDLVDFCLD
jgi:hypothetical protein